MRREAAAGGLVEARLVEDLVRWASAKRSPAGAVIALARQGALLDAQAAAATGGPGLHEAPEIVGRLELATLAKAARRADPDELRPETVEAIEAFCREVERWPRNARVAGLTTSEADHLREQVRRRRVRQDGGARAAGGAA